jgi:GDPmannose 4,6-dehydratase
MINSKTVLVTGVTGQDGANMCEFLLRMPGYKVYGMVRRSSNPNFSNCKAFINHNKFQLVHGDLTDPTSLDNLVREIQPDFFINFAANSFVGCSWNMPHQVFNTNALGVINCLEAIRKFKPQCRFYSAGSSEEFGDVDYFPQDMKHPIKPRSPYGAAKAAARHIVKVYRESYGMYAVHGILFNHEGTKRGEEFVTRKITKGVARIYWAIKNKKDFESIKLGNLNAKRDWSDSEDFVEGIWLMMNRNKPKDFLLASGKTHTIADFVNAAFMCAKIEGTWQELGEGVLGEYVPLPKSAKLIHKDSGKPLVEIDAKFFRPAEINLLLGDPTEAVSELGWRPKISFDKLVKKMVAWDINEGEEKTGST